MKKTDVAFIGYGLYAGGAEANTIQIVNYLLQKGIYTDIILFKKINEYKSRYSKIIKNLKIIPILDNGKKIPKILLPIKSLEFIIKLISLLIKKRYKLLVGFVGGEPFYLTVLLAKIFKQKSLLIVGDNITLDLKSQIGLSRKIQTFFYKLSFLFTDKIICVSYGCAFDIHKDFNVAWNKIRTVHNGLDSKVAKQGMKEKVSNKYLDFIIDNDLIVILGRLTPKKGHFHLIRILRSLKERNINIKLLIIGRGEIEDKLKKLINDFNLQNQVIFITKENKNPYKYLKLGKIFVFCSLYEGFGNVIVEAMNCGLPIISVDCPYGPREILDEKHVVYPYAPVKKITYCKYGVLTPPFKQAVLETLNGLTYEEKCMTKAIMRMINNKRLQNQFKAASLERSNNFTVNKMAKEYCQIIKSLCY